MIFRNKYIPIAFIVFGIMCGIFGFVTEVRNEVIIISSAFYLQMGILSILAAIYFETARK
ncbi:MAG: hypothetical protein WCV50_03135 [Patescibacteria group bacterium]|jgi:hypothetical protein